MKKSNRFLITSILALFLFLFSANAGEMVDDGAGHKMYIDDDGGYVYQDDRWIDVDGDGTYLCYSFDNFGYLRTSSSAPGGMVNGDGAYLTPRDYQVNTWKPVDDNEIYSKWVGEYVDDTYNPQIKIKIQSADANGAQLICSQIVNGNWTDVTYNLYFSGDKMSAFYTLYDTLGNIVQHEEFRLTNDYSLQASIGEIEDSMLQYRKLRRIS